MPTPTIDSAEKMWDRIAMAALWLMVFMLAAIVANVWLSVFSDACR